MCLSVPHRIPTLLLGPECNLEMVEGASSCALLGRCAIGARVLLLLQHSLYIFLDSRFELMFCILVVCVHRICVLPLLA